MAHFCYQFDDATAEYDERPYYCHFLVSKNSEDILDFYTNKALEGMFIETYKNGNIEYRQVIGTCDFRMPENPKAIRAKLYRMAKKEE